MCDEDVTHYRNGLIKVIRDNVALCQSKFGNCTLLATESDACVAKVIQAVELILQDGLRHRNASQSALQLKNVNFNVNQFRLRQVTELVSNGISKVMGPAVHEPPVFWNFVRNHLTRHEQERYYHLQNVTTDYGRGRSWLRSSINEHSLERYLKMLFSDAGIVAEYYETSAFFNRTECRDCLVDSARKLRGVIFALSVDRKELDQVDESKQLMIQSLQSEPKAVLPKPSNNRPTTAVCKKSKVRVVDLDGDADEATSNSGSSSGSSSGNNNASTTTSRTLSITIPEGRKPSLMLLNPPSEDSALSSRSCDSHDVPLTNNDSKHSTLSVFEMKQMLLDMTDKKRVLEEEKSVLHLQVHGLMLEKQQLDDRAKAAELHNSQLTKENVLLKDQLKKYMSAVQMLRTNADAETVAATPKLRNDQYEECVQYENKLVQVAEMHGELMEFNSRLQRQLQVTEHELNRTRAELVHLRGPLPIDFYPQDGRDHSDERDPCATATPLVHVWIPSAFLVQGSSDPHHIYQIYIRIGDEEWTVYKRYSQMYDFKKDIKKKHAFAERLSFPPKKKFGQRDEKTVEDRRRRLQVFLRDLINLWMSHQLPALTSPLNKCTFIQLFPFFGEQYSTDNVL